MLLSATINADVRKLAQRYMYEPVEVNLSQDEVVGQHDPAALHLGEYGSEVRPVDAFAQARPAEAVYRLHSHQARRRPACRSAAPIDLRRGGDPWRSSPVHARPRDARVSQRANLDLGRHRRRRPRHRRREHQPCDQLRHARRSRRTMSTGSAGPDGWARTASPTCSSAPIRANR